MECDDDLSTTQPSQMTINSYFDSAISLASGYNNSLADKSENTISLSANNVSNYVSSEYQVCY